MSRFDKSEGSLDPRSFFAITQATIESPRTKLKGVAERSSMLIWHEFDVVEQPGTVMKFAGDLALI